MPNFRNTYIPYTPNNTRLDEGSSSKLHQHEVLLEDLTRLSTLIPTLTTVIKLSRNNTILASRLPHEILCKILGFLDIRSLLAGAQIASSQVLVHVHTIYQYQLLLSTSLRLALAQCHRALRIQIIGKDIAHALPHTTAAAPLLQSLHLCNRNDADRQCILPSHIFAGHTPNLRSLTLEYISCAPEFFRSVRHLHVKVDRVFGLDLLGSLTHMHDLEKLQICGPGNRDVPHYASPIIILPSLRDITIQADAISALRFIRHLSVPSLSRLSLECISGWKPAENDLITLLPISASPQGTIISKPKDGLSVTLKRIFSMEIRTWITFPGLSSPSWRSSSSRYAYPPNPDVTLQIPTEHRTAPGILLRTLESIHPAYHLAMPTCTWFR